GLKNVKIEAVKLESITMSKPISFKSCKEFHQWLMKNHNQEDGIWIEFDKTLNKSSLKASEALIEALCFGWIDGQVKRIDESLYLKYFAKRRKNSKWSEKNKKLVLQLEESGLLQDSGRQKIVEAKQNGQWNTKNKVEVIDNDLQRLIEVIKDIEPAYSNFKLMSPSIQKTYTKAFMDPKTEAGKQKRIVWIIERLNQNLKPM
ncbi:YdeI/OmpD-associated family protein, partial [Anaerorhabdus sp.]|uniref:YdeI/OmpD-associated family protein n=2 Tax=Anaerorhabdus sp. TaxID=1872524 RepID=UPI002FCA57BF